MKKLYVLVLILLVACKNNPSEKILMHHVGEALGTTYSIRYESDKNFQNEIDGIFNRVNQSMSTYLPDSDISRLNAGEENIQVDSLFIEVFNASMEVWKATDGYFDPTVGPLVNAYGFGPIKKIDTLNPQVIDSLRQFVGIDKITIYRDGTVIKEDPRVFIDFNAIAKGYTVDLIGRMLDQKGIKNYLIEIGGELLAKGMNREKESDWVVAIDHPLQKESREIIKTIYLKNLGMATSGNYRKTYTDSLTGQVYNHTINPKTGHPQKNNILSVTVLAENSMLADAYATALLVMDFESSKNFLKATPIEVYMIYIDEDKNLEEYMTDGFKNRIVE